MIPPAERRKDKRQSKLSNEAEAACTPACTERRETAQAEMIPPSLQAIPLDPDLCRLLKAWPTLPAGMKRAMLALLEAATN